MHEVIKAIIHLLSYIQFAYLGIVFYGYLNEGSVPFETAKRYGRNTWIICGVIIALDIIDFLFFI